MFEFRINKQQVEKILTWQATHKEEYCGANGGRYTYSFTLTNMGMVVEVIDNITNERLNVTEYDQW
jgi:hypothetical protein